MKWLSFIILSLTLIACNKNKTGTFTVSGQITHYQTGAPLAGVTIQVYQNSSSGMNSGTNLIGSGTSDASGAYSIDFPRELVESYTFVYMKEGFFTEEVNKNFDDLRTDQNNIIDLAHRPVGWIRIFIENTAPTDPQDQLKIYKEKGTENCTDCCPDGYYYFDGATVNTSLFCPSISGEYFVFHYWDVLQPSYAKDSVLIQQNDTIDYYIQY